MRQAGRCWIGYWPTARPARQQRWSFARRRSPGRLRDVGVAPVQRDKRIAAEQ
jgi:hypothetical protein